MKQTFQKLIFCGLLLTATMAANAQFSGSGSGTSGDPYIVTNYTQLDEVRNNMSAHYRLEADVDAGSAWIPIGDANVANFTGTFDGNGYTVSISGLGTVTQLSSGYYYVGLFASTGNSGVIQNLKVEGTLSYTAPGNYLFMGGVVGSNLGTVKNCVGAVQITASANIESDAGGIAGYCGNPGTIENCYSLANITTSSITSSAITGGIAGGISVGTIRNCYATGALFASGANSYAGGISGENSSGALIEYCVALNSSLLGSTQAGRIVARNYGTLNNNRAIMISGLIDPGAPNSIDGLRISTTESETQSTYETLAGWAFGFTDTAPWAWDNTLKRPVLYWEVMPRIAGAVTITGAATYGGTLTANIGDITSPAPLGTVTYQWKRNGGNISGATGNT